MEISALTLRVLLLFFPGVLCAILVDALTVHRERSSFQFLTNSFVLGIGSYLLLFLARGTCAAVAGLFGWNRPAPLKFFAALADERARIAGGEIALAAAMSVVLAFIVSAALNHRILHRSARRLGVSRKFGAPDVWRMVFNSPRTQWVVVRDLGNDLTYYGAVAAFSDTSEQPEMLLRMVTVYRGTTGAKLYDAGSLYLARPRDTLTIEPMTSDERNAKGAHDVE